MTVVAIVISVNRLLLKGFQSEEKHVPMNPL